MQLFKGALAGLVVSMLALTGCGGSIPSGSGTPPPPPPAPAEYLFATSYGPLSAYSVDTTTGVLTPQASGPSAPGGFGMVSSPGARFLYSDDNAAGGVAAFSIGQTGTLSPVSGSPFLLPNAPPNSNLGNVDSLAMHPSGKFLYVPDAVADEVIGFGVDGTTGVLTPIPTSPFPAGPTPQQVAIDPAGRFLYVSNLPYPTPGTITGFTINSSTGALAPMSGSPFYTVSGGDTDGLLVHPSGKFVYSVVPNGNCIEAFMIDQTTGALTPMSGSPFTLGVQAFSVAYSIAQDPAGKFLYALGSIDERLYEFTVDTDSGVLTPVAGSPILYDEYLGLSSLVVDPSGKFLYFTGEGSGLVQLRIIDGATGALTLPSDSGAIAQVTPHGLVVVSVPRP